MHGCGICIDAAYHIMQPGSCCTKTACSNGRSCGAGAATMHGAAAEIQQESLRLLDWPAVCSQVACFASTPMAADQILQRGLPMGASKVIPLSITAQLHS